MPQFAPLFYAPDIDNAWSVAPGALDDIDCFAPLQQGSYGSCATANYFTDPNVLTGTDVLSAYMFRQIDGTVRFLVNRTTNLDEYNAAHSRTNQATGLTTATSWQMCALGNAIIAVSKENVTQVSTGTTFGTLGGSPPKAKLCASNFGFVMLADVNDGGSNNFGDMVWWSGINNHASWTPSIATEAGNIRLLEAPGVIRALVPFRDGFVAFKDNAIFLGEYVGPNFLWKWRPISHRIGCAGPDAVTELDGKLYFVHASGFYEFDSQNITSIGQPVNQTFLAECGFAKIGSAGDFGSGARGLYYTQTAADDIEGVVWFNVPYTFSSKYAMQLFGYNVRAKKWGRFGNRLATAADLQTGGTSGSYPLFVRATTADMQTFLANTTGRALMVWNDSATTTVQAVQYPAAGTRTPFVSTGMIGSDDGSATLQRVHLRRFGGSGTSSPTIVATGYTTESKSVTNGTNTGAWSSEFETAECHINSRYRTVKLTFVAEQQTLAGLAPGFGSNRR